MITPTHLLVAAAAVARPGTPGRNRAALFGALLPDLSIYVLFFWAVWIAEIPQARLWGVVYWSEPWQTLSAVSNSIPLFAALLALAWVRRWPVLAAFSVAALLHAALDLPVHAEDAHRHFWPLSDWRFVSPLSYWDPAHHADWVRPIETALAALCLVLLWRRFEGWRVRAALAATGAGLAAAPLIAALAFD